MKIFLDRHGLKIKRTLRSMIKQNWIIFKKWEQG